MDAKQWRIGNLGQNHDGTVLRVIELREKYIGTYVIDRSKFPLHEGWQLEPIPLTEEWLLKFGFDTTPMGFNVDAGNRKYIELAICNDKGKGEYYAYFRELADGGFGDDLVCFPARMFYVHQLQNLYFALTGEELIYNERKISQRL